MNFIEYQVKATGTADFPEIGYSHIYPALGLAGEVGEVLEKIKKLHRDGRSEVTAAFKTDLTKELGDVLWYVSQLSYEFGISLEDVASTNLKKLAARKQKDTIHGSGDNR